MKLWILQLYWYEIWQGLIMTSQLELWIHPNRISRSYVKMHAKMRMKFTWSGNWFHSTWIQTFQKHVVHEVAKISLKNGVVRKFYVENFEVGKIMFKLVSTDGIWKIRLGNYEVPLKLESLTKVINFRTSIDTYQLKWLLSDYLETYQLVFILSNFSYLLPTPPSNYEGVPFYLRKRIKKSSLSRDVNGFSKQLHHVRMNSFKHFSGPEKGPPSSLIQDALESSIINHFK